MSGKIPTDEAFTYYASLGPGRSYAAVAARFGVNKRSVTRHAQLHGWQARLDGLEAKARQRSDAQILDAIVEANERHLKMFKAIQAKALGTLQALPLQSALAAVRSLDLSIKGERLILGEPTDRSAVAVEDIIKREAARWLGNESAVTWDDFLDPVPGDQPDDDDEP